MGIIGAHQRTIIMAPPLPQKIKLKNKNNSRIICEHEVSQTCNQPKRKREQHRQVLIARKTGHTDPGEKKKSGGGEGGKRWLVLGQWGAAQ